MAAKRGPTAFFIFSEEQREATRAECLAAAEPGAKVSVATVAKAIGEKWRGLSDEDKAGYKEKAAQRAAESAAQAEAADADRGAADGAGAARHPTPHACTPALPCSGHQLICLLPAGSWAGMQRHRSSHACKCSVTMLDLLQG
jgi:hypothetical protein